MKFILLNIKDKQSPDHFILGSNRHHMLTVNEQGSLDFINLQNHGMTGKDSSYTIDVDPDNDDLIPLVSFETLMQEIKPSLNFDSTDENEYNKAVGILQTLISKAEEKENQRLKNIVGQSVDEYLKHRVITDD